MNISPNTMVTVQKRLAPLNHADLEQLAAVTDLGFATLVKLRLGYATNPRLQTLLKLLPHLPAPQRARRAARI